MSGAVVRNSLCIGFISLPLTLLQALLLGCSCGCCGRCDCVNKRCAFLALHKIDLSDYHSQYFRISFAQGYFVLSVLCCVIEMSLGMYRFYDGYEYEILILSQVLVMIVSLLGLVCIWVAIGLKKWSQLMMLQGCFVLSKFSYSVYLVSSHVIKYGLSLSSDHFIFLYTISSLDAFLIVLCTLWPVLSIKLTAVDLSLTTSPMVQAVPFVAWTFEVFDVISTYCVCFMYANDAKQNQQTNFIFNNNDWTMPSYFVLFLSKLVLFCFSFYLFFFCPKMCQRNCQYKWLMGAYIFFLDVITDGSLLMLTFATQTYEGHEYIIFDTFFKFYLLLRALLICSTANKATDVIVDQKSLDWSFSLEQAYNVLPAVYDEGQDLWVGAAQELVPGAEQQPGEPSMSAEWPHGVQMQQMQQMEHMEPVPSHDHCKCRWRCISFLLVVIFVLLGMGGYYCATQFPSPQYPTESPTSIPSSRPTTMPTYPSLRPSTVPTDYPSIRPTMMPSVPTSEPTFPSLVPTNEPSPMPTLTPTPRPTKKSSSNRQYQLSLGCLFSLNLCLLYVIM